MKSPRAIWTETVGRWLIVIPAVTVLIAVGLLHGDASLSPELNPRGGGVSARERSPRGVDDFDPASAPAMMAENVLNTDEAQPNAAAPVNRLSDEQMAVIRQATLKDILPDLMTPIGDWRSVMPEQLTVCPLPGVAMTFRASTRELGTQRNTWVGKNGVEGVSLAFCATKELWDAVVTIPGGNAYRIHATHEGATVYELFDDKQACGWADQTSAELIRSAAADVDSAAEGLYTVDVLVAYTTGSKTYWGGTPDEVLNAYSSVCASINTYYADSRVTNLRLNAVGAVELRGYTNSKGLMDDDLRAISDPAYAGAASSVFAVVNSEREAVRADLVQLIVDGERDWAGLAWVNGVQSVVRAGVTPFTMAHEIGHNFGCRHDRQTEKASDDDSSAYHYGHIHEHPMRYGDQVRVEKVGTLMSYAATRIPYFSNPDVSYEGIPVGIEAGQKGAANNAKILREGARAMSRIMQGSLLPVITQQPVSCTTKPGATFKLSVLASGEDLRFQWYKRVAEGNSVTSVAVAGARSAKFSKVFTLADAAAYFVVVSNASGMITSSTATVALDTGSAAAESAASASSGSATQGAAAGVSGGGGGAVSPLALMLLAALAAGRLVARGRGVRSSVCQKTNS